MLSISHITYKTFNYKHQHQQHRSLHTKQRHLRVRRSNAHTHTNTPHVDWLLSNLYFDVEKKNQILLTSSLLITSLNSLFIRDTAMFAILFAFFCTFFWMSQICTRLGLLVNLLQLLFFTALRCNASTLEEEKKLFVSFSAVVFYFELLTGNLRRKSIDILSRANSSKQNYEFSLKLQFNDDSKWKL